MPSNPRTFVTAGCVLGLMLAAGCSQDPRPSIPVRTFRVEDFGAKADDPAIDSAPGIQKAIDAAIAAGPGAQVLLGAGRYYLRPAGGDTCLHVNKADGLTIRGQGVRTELLSTDPDSAILYYGYSRNTMVGDFVVDYDPLPFTQGGVVAVDPQKASFDVRIDDGFPDLAEGGFPAERMSLGRLLDRAKRRLKAQAPDHFGIAWEPLGGRVWRVRIRWAPLAGPFFVAPGDVLVVSRGGGPGAGAAVWVDGCVRSSLRNVTIYASCGLGVALTGAEDFTFDGLRICYRPATTRMQSTNADGLHCSGNRKGPTVENCLFEGMCDDGININCHGSRIVQVRSPTQVVIAGGMGAEKGGRLQVFDMASGAVRDVVEVVSVVPEGGKWVVTFDRPVADMRPCTGDDKWDGHVTYNLAVAGEGYVIRNNVFRRHRRYAILARPGSGLVENNLIEEVSGQAIVLENDFYFGEGPLGRGVVVRGNTVRAVGYALGYADSPQSGAIEVRTYKNGGGFSSVRNRRDVVIENNRILDAAGAAIYVGGAAEVRLTGNEIRARASAPIYGKGGAIILDSVAGVAVERCRVDDPRPQTTAAVEIRGNVPAGAEGVIVSKLRARLSSNSKSVDDKREQ